MSPSLIALLVSGTLVFGSVLKLFLDTGGAPPAPDAAKVADAKARHGRAAPPPSPASVGDPWAAAREGGPPMGRVRDPEPEPAPAPRVEPPKVVTPQAAAVPDLQGDPRLELSTAKDEANRLYDRQDFEAAMEQAAKVLEKSPGDVRMLRVMVSAACQMGDADKAQRYWNELPPHDQNQMTRRCQRYGITFVEN